MKIFDFLMIVFGTSMTSVYVYSKPAWNYDTLLLPDDVIRVKKRHEDTSSGYLEQCGLVTFPMAQRGVVNVLAFLDSSWPYSHRQAVMLKMLNNRLQRSGLPDTLFFVVNVDPSFARTADTTEDDLEREAWLGVSPEEIDSLTDIDRTSDSLAMSMNPDIQLIQDNEKLGIWKELRGSRDQVLVIDRCGKLTYQVIVPWSILHFPYVKAAILSTYKDEPCGPCSVIHNKTDVVIDNLVDNSSGKTTLDPEAGSLTTGEYFLNDRESLNVGDDAITTEYDLPGEEDITEGYSSLPNFVTSTKYENGNVSGPCTENTDETASTIIFPEQENFDVTTESASPRSNVIGNMDSDASMESSTEKSGDSGIPIGTTDFSIVDSSSRRGEEVDTTTIFGVAFNSSDTDSTTVITSDTTNDYVTENFNTIEDIDAITEKASEPQTERFFLFREKLVDLGNNSEATDSIGDAISETTDSALNVNTIDSSIDTTTEERFDSNTESNFRFDKKSEDLKISDSEIDRLTGSTEMKKMLSEMPIRIIMHAPHFHVDGDSTRMHEYLVMKTGSYDYHGHLASPDATRLYRGPQDFQEIPGNLPSEEIRDKHWPMMNVIYGKDESPGLYGEVADYWRGLENQENYDDTEETEKPEEQVAEETGSDDKMWKNPLKTNNNHESSNGEIIHEESTSGPERIIASTEKLMTDVADQSVTDKLPMRTEEFNPEEEETRNRLIAHYSKLFPWIYYVLDK